MARGRQSREQAQTTITNELLSAARAVESCKSNFLKECRFESTFRLRRSGEQIQPRADYQVRTNLFSINPSTKHSLRFFDFLRKSGTGPSRSRDNASEKASTVRWNDRIRRENAAPSFGAAMDSGETEERYFFFTL
jgi:hypothetical protein